MYINLDYFYHSAFDPNEKMIELLIHFSMEKRGHGSETNYQVFEKILVTKIVLQCAIVVFEITVLKVVESLERVFNIFDNALIDSITTN